MEYVGECVHSGKEFPTQNICFRNFSFSESYCYHLREGKTTGRGATSLNRHSQRV